MNNVDIIQKFNYQNSLSNIEVTRKNGLVCCVDWLSFTDVANTDIQASLSEFGFALEEFVLAEKGASGYKKMLLHRGSTLRVLYDGNENMGIHYDFSGSSIKELFCHFNDFIVPHTPFGPDLNMDINILRELLSRIKQVGHVTRLDLAIDDKVCPYFTLPELQNILEQQRFISKFRTWQLVKDCTTTNQLIGATIYLGSRRSDIMLRVYDKQLEQIAKGVEDADAIPWVRWELELKNEYANVALVDLLNGVDVGSLVFGILSNYFRIIIFDDSNKSRCSMDEKWKQFIDEVSKIQLFVIQEPPTLLDKRDWVMKQVAPTITGLILADYGDISWLYENFSANAGRMSKHLKKLVSQVNPDWQDMIADFD